MGHMHKWEGNIKAKLKEIACVSGLHSSGSGCYDWQ
jgi:hypothetical protein